MKRKFLVFAAACAGALSLGACTQGYYGASVGYGGGYGYGYPGYYPAYGYGWDPYDVWYDGFYGPYYNGFWGTDGFFWFQDGHRRWRRGDGDHFHHGGDHDGHWDHDGGN